ASIKEGNNLVGSRTRVKIVKNKCAPPFKQAEFDIMFNQGVSREGLLVDMGESIGIVSRAGAWYSYGGDVRLGQGRENSKTFLRENPDIAEEIEARIREELGMTIPESDTADAAAGAGAEKEGSKNSRPPSTQAARS
ncbi:MAG: DNA recombination/repair protein RecA, partial [Gemmatimonadales bacterium]|nr:DNA recombination/repair protein RecA [Gemmatimonadales bacterium]